MKKEAIWREDAIKSLVAYFEYVDYVMTKGKHEKFKVYDPPKLADDIIGRLPSADVVERDYKGKQLQAVYNHGYDDAKAERKRGEWIDTGSGQECSVCGEIQYGYDSMRKFCANCGADNRPKLAGKHADQIIIDEAVADMRGAE